jgi:radical SAM superfamily enzyme
MAKEYLEFPDRFQLFELEEYVEFIVKFIEQLNPNFVIERFAGEVPPRFLVSEPWKIRNDQILQKIEKKLEEKDSWQGKYWK